MTNPALLSFTEVARELGVDLEKVRRLVVEDRSIDVVVVDGGGIRKAIDLQGFLADGHWRVDEHGRLCVVGPVYEGRQLVGSCHTPLDVGELRIERAQLDQHRLRWSTAKLGEQPSESVAAVSSPAQPSSLNVPTGLDPDTVATAFDGLWKSRLQWIEALKKPGKWLNSPPVVTRRGQRGRGQAGEPVPTLRNPVELAKHLICEERCTPYNAHTRFMKSHDLAEWRSEWEAYRSDVKELTGR